MKVSAFLLTAFLVACGGASDSTGPVTLPGVWQLASVDKGQLPVTLLEGSGTSCSVTLRSADITLSSGGTYTSHTSYGTLVDGSLYCESSASEAGSYSQAGNQITLHDGTGFTHSVTFSNSNLTANVFGKTYAYRK